MPQAVVNLAYLVASILFILGLKGLSHPRTAVRGNLAGACGMLLAVVVTLLDRAIVSYELIVAGLVLGTAFGIPMALRVPMTAMPQLVALFNGFGGGASVLVAGAVLVETILVATGFSTQLTVSIAASAIVGAVTFWGSLVAFGKLQGVISEKSVSLPAHQLWNGLLGLACLALAGSLVVDPPTSWGYWALVLAASLLGVTLVLPIGGADMPVVIALLNSYSGIAASATGFVLSNSGLIIAGALVGASGIILTRIMCRAMNRSLTSVLFGVMAPAEGAAAPGEDIYAGKIKATSPEEVAMLFDSARRVVIVPGYGLAVAQAQHAVRDLANALESKGIVVEYGIHPVAGRMPGHMNVLLADANVPYEKLKDMDEINATFEQTDVVLVIGANDVVNPLARTDASSPIAGMPILEVDRAKTVVVMKRSLSPGFA
ncbi:MAG TPA: NAD(P)(+) transhydrogenase (Re/Si-specific) subunit beta, partial [Candidatus Binatia bacterium]|nr:NAD(P)(+) transhydrogenase (Re/Si-specific) subunit beta [Candidatus Binatia bacterium]